MKVRLRSRSSIFLFALVIVVVGTGGSVLLNFAVFDPEILPVTVRGTLQIAPVVCLPLGYLCAQLIANSTRMADELARLVNRDRLTDVATRDYFYKRMGREPDAFGVSLMIDIDHFKRINDTHGHPIGDRVITAVAQCLNDQTRAEDIVCRYGGEEFVVFLRDRDRADGFTIAERMRNAIANAVMEFDGQQISTTVSIGASLKERVIDIDAAIKDADAALYRAKSRGRNVTVFADPAGPKVALA